jgi:hypothetical protein
MLNIMLAERKFDYSRFSDLISHRLYFSEAAAATESASALNSVARWRCGRTLGYGPTGGRWTAGSIPDRPVTKSRSTADMRVAAVGKLFALIALAELWQFTMGLVWQPFDMAPTCKPGVAAVDVRHLLIHCRTA